MALTTQLSVGVPDDAKSVDYMEITAAIITAYLSKNHVPVSELPSLLSGVHSAIVGLDKGQEAPAPVAEKPTPAQIRKSVTPNAVISFIDGKPYKTLKRHLTKHGLTMVEYRERFGLPWDYPSTARSYSERRSALAKGVGLGRKVRSESPKEGTDA